MIPTPTELLQKEYETLKRDALRSSELYNKGEITFELHKTHISNLSPKIKEYEQAIAKLLE